MHMLTITPNNVMEFHKHLIISGSVSLMAVQSAETCGHCVGGKTGKSLNFGKDICGICSGDGTTCLDCAGVPRGWVLLTIIHKSETLLQKGCYALHWGSVSLLIYKIIYIYMPEWSMHCVSPSDESLRCGIKTFI